MAKLAKDNAKHDEIKKLADDILSAQSKEIDMMQTWQTDWGYESSSSQSDDMMNMMFSKSAEVSKFIVKKLYRYFIYYKIKEVL